MTLRDTSIENFTESIASKSSVPGGGGASALVASVGIALGDMVGEFTIGKKKYESVEEDIKLLMKKAQDMRLELLSCIDEDALAFEPLSRAYSIPKEQANRDEIMEKCLKDAAKVPFKILEITCKAIDLQEDFANKGSVIMISDAATGVALLQGALKGAAINVRVNTKLMKDRVYAQDLDSKVDDLLDIYLKKADKIYDYVVERL